MVMMTIPPATAQQPEEQADQEDNQEYPEEDQGYLGDSRCNSSKPKDSGNDGQDEQNDNEFHLNPLALLICRLSRNTQNMLRAAQIELQAQNIRGSGPAEYVIRLIALMGLYVPELDRGLAVQAVSAMNR